MRYSLIILISVLLSSCSKLQFVDKKFSKIKKIDSSVFEGYRFVCDSLGDINDLKEIVDENGFDLNRATFIKPSIDKFGKCCRVNLLVLSLFDFFQKPPFDTTITYNFNEVNAINKYIELDNQIIEDSLDTKGLRKIIDSLLHSVDFVSYEKKRFRGTSMLVILYPAIIQKNKMIVAYRLYHDSKTSDAGSIRYKVF